jgi:hypothetical protein
MRTTPVSAGLFAAALLLISSSAAQGQAASPSQPAASRATATGAASIPRLLDGKPDMQGYWTNQTFTPLERPAQFKDKAFFTQEEAAAWAKRGIDNIVEQPRGEEVKSDADIHYDDAIWMLEGYAKGAMLRTSIITAPADGKIPPLTEEGQKRAQARAAARKSIGPFDNAQARGLSERCIYWAHEGPPLLPTGYNSNLQIVQAPMNFVVIPEMMPVARVVPLDGRARVGTAIRAYRGDSRGRWDGDTMVIETANYSEKTAWRGATENMKVTERLTMVDRNTIRYQFTVEDPSTWTQPWSGEYEMTRIDGPLFEYACHEGNYGLPSILKGARLAEAAARK